MSTSTTADASATEGVLHTIAAYAHALDDGRTDDIVALFTPDGTSTIVGYGDFTGPDAIRSAYANLVPQAPQRHMTGNTIVTVADGQATSTSDFVMFVRGEAGWASAVVGRYQDTLVEVDGHWAFSTRITEVIM